MTTKKPSSKESSVRLKHAAIIKSTVKASLVEVNISWTHSVGDPPLTTRGTKSYAVWIPKSQLTQTQEGEIYVPSWIVEKKETEIAEKLEFSTVEILVLED